MDGVVRAPSAFSITWGLLPSITATQELVVPRSIPIAFAMTKLLFRQTLPARLVLDPEPSVQAPERPSAEIPRRRDDHAGPDQRWIPGRRGGHSRQWRPPRRGH